MDADPAGVYRLVSDVAAVSRWSPSASEVAFDEGSGPEAGAWLGGRNRRDGKEPTTRSQVVRAEPGGMFAYVVCATARRRAPLVALADRVTRNPSARQAPRRG
ncbi:SRPBCC family protein [Lentzea cavernae]|uniref:SRPBCC family protein n=1 Tax=Lentzea cavernae TaxID=2020703 RepID=UPI0017482DDF